MSALPQVDDDRFEIGLVRAPCSSEFWPAAKALLHPALIRGDETWEAVERDLTSNATQLWLVLEAGLVLAAAVTRVCKTRDGEVAEVYLVGGREHRRWLGPLANTIEASARDIGCLAIRAFGRAGWRKALGDLGWGADVIAYEKPLSRAAPALEVVRG